MNVKVRDVMLSYFTMSHRFCILQKRMLKGAPWKIYVYLFLEPVILHQEAGPKSQLHDGNLPTSSTCSLIIRLPTVHKTYISFKGALILGLKSNDGFGGP